ncbi:MAG: trypsin-like peptidase domain-containing protein [Firmicutes bacterium]|nr:trypsin-like peptidase domain-containing protein [Bacillota bacterium]
MNGEEYHQDTPAEFGEDEDQEEVSRAGGCLKKALALLTVLAFIALISLDFTNLFSGRFSFLDQSKDLAEDEIVRRCRPAVVSVEAGLRRGTGFNISPSGTVITNQHIVGDSRMIVIQFGDGRRYFTDQYRAVPGADLVVVTVRDDARDLPVVELDRENRVKSGDTVTIIGNPLGFEKISQRGSVGSFHRTTDSQTPIFDINIPINPGNSGSPVINSRGKVVGIVFASTTVQTDGGPETRALAFPVQVLPE